MTRHQLKRDSSPVVVCDDASFLDSEVAPDRLCEVALLEDRVRMVSRFVGVAKAEEVEAEHPEARLEPGHDLRPVPGARRKGVQERQPRAGASNPAKNLEGSG